MTETLPDSEDRASLPTKHRGVLMVAVMAVSIIQFLDVTIANVALPHMRSSLGASIDTITWVLTSYIIAMVVFAPLVGWFSDRLGSRRVFLVAIAGFLLASMLCGAATSLTQMVVFRALQGICAAFIGPMSQTIMFDVTAPSRQPAAMSLWGIVVMIAPISGPVLGGLITESMDWRWVFYVNLPIGIPTLLVLTWLLPGRPVVERKLDRTGFCLLAVGLGALQLVLDRGQHQDWFESWEIIVELLVAGAAFWMYLVHTLTTPHTLFPRELMRNGNFLGSLAFMFLLGVANVAIASVLPIMFQNIYNYPALDTGLLMAPRGIGVLMTMPLAARLMKTIDLRYLIVFGYCVAALALWTMSQWSMDMDRWPIVASGLLQGTGLGFIFVPMNMMAFSTLAPQFRPDGSGLLNLMRSIGGSFGISVIATMLARNTQIAHEEISGHLTSYNLGPLDPLATAERFGPTGAALMQALDMEVNRQALMIAYIDNFYAMAIFIAVVAPAALLLRPIKAPAGQPVPARVAAQAGQDEEIVAPARS